MSKQFLTQGAAELKINSGDEYLTSKKYANKMFIGHIGAGSLDQDKLSKYKDKDFIIDDDVVVVDDSLKLTLKFGDGVEYITVTIGGNRTNTYYNGGSDVILYFKSGTTMSFGAAAKKGYGIRTYTDSGYKWQTGIGGGGQYTTDQTFSASFTKIPTYTFTVDLGEGIDSISVDGILYETYPTLIDEDYPVQTITAYQYDNVTLTAKAKSNYTFSYWSKYKTFSSSSGVGIQGNPLTIDPSEFDGYTIRPETELNNKPDPSYLFNIHFRDYVYGISCECFTQNNKPSGYTLNCFYSESNPATGTNGSVNRNPLDRATTVAYEIFDVWGGATRGIISKVYVWFEYVNPTTHTMTSSAIFQLDPITSKVTIATANSNTKLLQ